MEYNFKRFGILFSERLVINMENIALCIVLDGSTFTLYKARFHSSSVPILVFLLFSFFSSRLYYILEHCDPL